MTRVAKKIESSLRKAFYDYKMIENEAPIAVALSGGKDSVTLLMMLKKVSGRGFPAFPLQAIHVSGEFSCGASVQENYLKSVCEALDVPLHIVPSKQKLENLSCYSCSRERRSLLFAKAKAIGAKTIAFGHHRDDSVQTLLMNLLQKGEFAANLPKIAMVHYGVTIIRPLILIPESDIIAFAKEQGFWRMTCQCPVGQDSMRRKVKDLLGEIERLYPLASLNLAQAGLTYGSTKALTP